MQHDRLGARNWLYAMLSPSQNSFGKCVYGTTRDIDAGDKCKNFENFPKTENYFTPKGIFDGRLTNEKGEGVWVSFSDFGMTSHSLD